MTKVKVGDIVKRVDYNGLHTGMLYQVVSVAEPNDHSVRQRYSYKKVRTRKVKLRPVVTVFDSRLSTNRRNTVSGFEVELQVISIVDIGLEYQKLGMFLQDMAREGGTTVEEDQPCPP